MHTEHIHSTWRAHTVWGPVQSICSLLHIETSSCAHLQRECRPWQRCRRMLLCTMWRCRVCCTVKRSKEFKRNAKHVNLLTANHDRSPLLSAVAMSSPAAVDPVDCQFSSKLSACSVCPRTSKPLPEPEAELRSRNVLTVNRNVAISLSNWPSSLSMRAC